MLLFMIMSQFILGTSILGIDIKWTYTKDTTDGEPQSSEGSDL